MGLYPLLNIQITREEKYIYYFLKGMEKYSNYKTKLWPIATQFFLWPETDININNSVFYMVWIMSAQGTIAWEEWYNFRIQFASIFSNWKIINVIFVQVGMWILSKKIWGTEVLERDHSLLSSQVSLVSVQTLLLTVIPAYRAHSQCRSSS